MEREVSAEEIKTYLLAWLIRFSDAWVLDEDTYEVDKALGYTDDEVHFEYCTTNGLLLQKEKDDNYFRLSAKGRKYINKK